MRASSECSIFLQMASAAGKAIHGSGKHVSGEFGRTRGFLPWVLLLLVQSQAAYAATISVTTTNDELNTDGDCSLREAIEAANTDSFVDNCTAGSIADTIIVPAGTYILTIRGAGEDANETGDLDVTGDLVVNGAGLATIIDGNSTDRVFHILSGTVGISDLTVQNGYVAGAGLPGSGGGIFSRGTLTLTNSTVIGNMSGGSFPGGGGIFNDDDGTLTLVGSTVAYNNSDEYAGGIFSYGTLTLTNSAVTSNMAVGGYGGGIASLSGTLTLNDSTVSFNSTNSHAGGIYILGGPTASVNNSNVSGNSSGQSGGGILNFAILALSNSTVSGNQAGGDGGGGIRNQGDVTVTNSTISGNTATFRQGGGILNNATGIITNSTLSDNSAGGGGGGIASPQDFPAVTWVRNTIVGNNTPNDCQVDSPATLTSVAHNLSSDSSCAFIATGDLQDTDPMLGPLASNGGPTETRALLAGSPAIDGVGSGCPPPSTDQRGVGRPQGPACDIGAFELATGMTVAIDIKPGSSPNSINTGKKGVIPVAVLGTSTFDPAMVDPSTVCFGEADDTIPSQRDCTEAHGKGHVQDADGDGNLDMVLHFDAQETGIDPGDTQACLTGKLFDDTSIEGCDSIKTK